ncbi:hypothetical protein OEV98_13770 [Caldibacillus lycopersici]|uniref:Uncharacterized protein n=1 Tax=Perspicuibacillus lycopersici TaxID=1325689 RepID=A0AAE3LP63_9BACI|nr:hypothetical protein [Perspicuibacillus lycopersici]MCU9614607.1 hypothetical protein [Perspicuibacillus lycopersici]
MKEKTSNKFFNYLLNTKPFTRLISSMDKVNSIHMKNKEKTLFFKKIYEKIIWYGIIFWIIFFSIFCFKQTLETKERLVAFEENSILPYLAGALIIPSEEIILSKQNQPILHPALQFFGISDHTNFEYEVNTLHDGKYILTFHLDKQGYVQDWKLTPLASIEKEKSKSP